MWADQPLSHLPIQ